MTLTTHSLLPDAAATSAVIFLHGVGADGRDLLSLGSMLRPLLPETAFFAPDAPQPFDMAAQGRQWFSLQEYSLPAIGRGLEQSAWPALRDYVTHIGKEHALDSQRIMLFGFSQGAMTTLYSVYRQSLACGGVIACAGLMTDSAALAEGTYPPALIVHGAQDEVVPPQGSQQAADILRRSGVAAECFIEPGIPHSIGPQSLQKAAAFLKERLG